MCEYLPHINNSFVGLHPENVLTGYTAKDNGVRTAHGVLAVRDWFNFGGIPLAVEIRGS
jgi:hypothetical protein